MKLNTLVSTEGLQFRKGLNQVALKKWELVTQFKIIKSSNYKIHRPRITCHKF